MRADLAKQLHAASHTYAEVGRSAGALPPGYRHFSRASRPLEIDLAEARELLLTWRVHERAGLRVAASTGRVEEGSVVLMRLGLGPLAVRAPCRVVYVIDEPSRAGFAYGSLPGHPERGEELFLLERDDLGRVTFTVTGFSKPATLLARAGGLVTSRVQDRMTSRYLGAFDEQVS